MREDRLDLLPLRQAVTATGDATPVFARPALLEGLSKPGRFRILGHGQGGQILAASAYALAEAQVLLRQAYGERVTFGIVSVHTYVDEGSGEVMVPMLFARIDAPRRHMHELLGLLKARGARMQDVELRRDRVLLRAELAFARAVDLHHTVLVATDGSAHFLSWLLGYRPARDAEEAAGLRAGKGPLAIIAG